MFWFYLPPSPDFYRQTSTDTDTDTDTVSKCAWHRHRHIGMQCMTRELVNSSIKKPSNTIYTVGWVWLGCYQISIFARPVVGFFFGCWLVSDFFFLCFLVLVLVLVLCCVGDFRKRDCACR